MDDDDRLVELALIIRRSLRSRTADQHLIEDITQDTMLRVAVAQTSLDPAVLRAYAIVTARNNLNSHLRRDHVARRHAHRVVDYTTLAGAEELTLQREETDALAEALDTLDEADRHLLLDHEVDQISVAVLAADAGTSSGAITMRLARARAELRLEFLLSFRRVRLPTDRCRQILLSISAGDQRRQRHLRADDHLAVCPTCAELSDPLLQRRRGAAARWLPPVPALFARLGHKLRTSRTTQAAVATGAVIIAVTGFVVFHQSSSSLATPPPTTSLPGDIATTTATGIAITPATTIPATTTPSTTAIETTAAPGTQCPPIEAIGQQPPTPGCVYTIPDVTVTNVPADEGFWITFIDNAPIWVHLTSGTESPQHVRPGDHVTLQATITAPDDGTDPGIPEDQRGELTSRGFYLSAPDDRLQIIGP